MDEGGLLHVSATRETKLTGTAETDASSVLKSRDYVDLFAFNARTPSCSPCPSARCLWSKHLTIMFLLSACYVVPPGQHGSSNTHQPQHDARIEFPFGRLL